MDACKYVVPLWHRVTLNSRQAASRLVRLVEGEERRWALTTSRVFFLKIEVEPSQVILPPDDAQSYG
ncbi:hypothetical protein TNCV_403611 [Trichonephila clavipes]|nr:hypothetical protein TNCV_403611 [Trichonephila clavipes]